MSPICLMVRSSIDPRKNLVLIGPSWAWASLVILPSGRIELVASAFPFSESLRGLINPISQSVGQLHWHWRIRFLLFQKWVQIPLPCCWVCPSFFLLEEWLAHFFIHHWIGSCLITHDGCSRRESTFKSQIATCSISPPYPPDSIGLHGVKKAGQESSDSHPIHHLVDPLAAQQSSIEM